MKKIAITGGIASGKSSVCQFFKELGAYVVFADAIVHDLLESDRELCQRITEQFGLKIVRGNRLDKKALADLAFENPGLLQKLERLIHPKVFGKIESLYKEVEKTGEYSLFIVEIPLLYETNADFFYDATIAVISDEKEAKKRFQKKGFEEEEYTRRMKRHFSPQEKAAKAQHIITNNGSLEDLKKQVLKLNHILKNN